MNPQSLILGNLAIVIGGSITGLLTAKILIETSNDCRERSLSRTTPTAIGNSPTYSTSYSTNARSSDYR